MLVLGTGRGFEGRVSQPPTPARTKPSFCRAPAWCRLSSRCWDKAGRKQASPAWAGLAFQWERPTAPTSPAQRTWGSACHGIRSRDEAGLARRHGEPLCEELRASIRAPPFGDSGDVYRAPIMCQFCAKHQRRVREPGGKVSRLPASHRDRRETIRALLKRGGAVGAVRRAPQGEGAGPALGRPPGTKPHFRSRAGSAVRDVQGPGQEPGQEPEKTGSSRAPPSLT